MLAQVKDDNAAKGVPERPAGMCALVKRRYGPLIRRSPKGEPGELRPDHRSFRAGYQTGVRISRMKGTAERQVLPPAFMRGEGHAVAGGVPRSGGESLLSHGFAVPAPPEGKPRGLRPDHRSFRAGYQTGVRISRMKGAVYRFAPQIPPGKIRFPQ